MHHTVYFFSGGEITVKTSDYDYLLPPEMIAQTPLEHRDHSRLLVLNRQNGTMEHRHFLDIVDYLKAGDVLVFNNSRVIPARLYGRRSTGGKVEILLLHRVDEGIWEALVGRGGNLHAGSKIDIINSSGAAEVVAEVIGEKPGGIKILRFSDENVLVKLGKMPLPPYIHEALGDPERYQTVYSKIIGSAAAPTAGLHFTPQLLEKIGGKGVCSLFVTLHIGLDTFSPVREADPQKHAIHKEYGIVDEEVAQEVTQAKREGRRVICVGTTSTRIIEHIAQNGSCEPFSGWVDLFILPGHRFRAADALITNFHLPRSTLLMLVSAFAGKDLVDKAYQEAIRERYRFYSFGDAMLIL
ncbi:MAG: tRNA preQ1(34) S-adenosylmethionine ribosyltransferase-isomerase QueA [Dehalococcoidales bacterium]|nr:tRNA preQ1(34) S-adenosylmethionine ribosyltransferase-isomerase QueA [Dehalococcoidales bacterium]